MEPQNSLKGFRKVFNNICQNYEFYEIYENCDIYEILVAH